MNKQLGPEDVFSTMPPSEGLKILASTTMTGHDDESHTDGPMQVATWDVSQAHLHGGRCTHVDLHLSSLMGTIRRARGPDSAGACTEREMQCQSGKTLGQMCKDCSVKVRVACPAFFYNQGGNLKLL